MKNVISKIKGGSKNGDEPDKCQVKMVILFRYDTLQPSPSPYHDKIYKMWKFTNKQ